MSADSVVRSSGLGSPFTLQSRKQQQQQQQHIIQYICIQDCFRFFVNNTIIDQINLSLKLKATYR
jgi:hypothetical protein